MWWIPAAGAPLYWARPNSRPPQPGALSIDIYYIAYVYTCGGYLGTLSLSISIMLHTYTHVVGSFGGLGSCSCHVCVCRCRGCCSLSVCVCDLLTFLQVVGICYWCAPLIGEASVLSPSSARGSLYIDIYPYISICISLYMLSIYLTISITLHTYTHVVGTCCGCTPLMGELSALSPSSARDSLYRYLLRRIRLHVWVGT